LVRRTWLGGEVVHLVVQEETRARHEGARAVQAVYRGGGGHGVPVRIHYRVVRGLVPLAKALVGRRRQRGGRDRTLVVHGGPLFLRVLLAGELRYGNVHERRVAEPGVAVDERPLVGTGQPVEVLRAAERRSGVVRLHYGQRLRYGHAARAGRGHPQQRVAAERRLDRLAPLGLVATQVGRGHDPAGPAHLGLH